ncbi:MAG TPA: TonB family protein [Polyangiaceae bacterium]|nr:TonB family protein [Polyangiaceae bacterium]
MARRKGRSPILIASIAFHVVLGGAVAFIPKEKLREVIGISMVDADKPEPPKPAPPRPNEPPPPRPAAAGRRSSAPAPAAPAAVAAEAAPAAFTDIGISLDSNAIGGIVVPVAAKVEAEPPPVIKAEPTKAKVLAAKAVSGACEEPIVKAKVLKVEQPGYTQAARSAGIQGRVQLILDIDEQGNVINARTKAGLGYGLDEAALAAAKKMRFSPATRCGKPVAAPFVLAIRFVLGS